MALTRKCFAVSLQTPPQNGSALSKYSEGIYRDQTIKKLLRGLIFRLSRDLPLEGIFISTHKIGPSQSSLSEGIYRNRPITNNFPGTLKKALSNGLTSGGVSQEHPIPSLDKEVITTRQLNNRHRKRYDRAMTSKERARRRRGGPGAGIQKPYRKDGALSQ